MLINPNQTPQQNSNLILQTSSPRPIAWIVTEDKNGIVNIAPYSLFTPLSFDPPRLIVSFRAKEDGDLKDTLNNIRQTKKCTICMVQKRDKERMHQTSEEIPSGESEAEKFDIKTNPILEGYPAVIATSPIAYFCKLSQEIKLEGDSTTPLVLDIKKIFLDNAIIQDQDSLKIEFDAVGHIVGDKYQTQY